MPTTYEVAIDWGGHGGLNLSDFEKTTNGWVPASSSTLPLLALSTSIFYQGTKSLSITWPNTSAFTPPGVTTKFTFDDGAKGFDTGQFDSVIIYPYVYKDLTNLVIDREYTISVWSYAWNQLNTLTVEGMTGSSTNVGFAAWEELTLTFTAMATTHRVRVSPNTPPTATTLSYIDWVTLSSVWDSTTILDAGGLDFSYGRDSSRSLSPSSPGDASFQSWNIDGLYSPDNVDSPLYGQLSPGRQVRISAKPTGDIERNLYMGYVDGYTIDPKLPVSTANFTCTDLLGILAEIAISTEVVPSGTTGQLMHYVLDAAGWPADLRDIDTGSTVVSWWHVHEINAYEALQQLCDSEGSPAYISSDGQGRFVFRDRQHRNTRTRSTAVQASFYPRNNEGGQVYYSDPLGYDIGWKDLINSCTFSVDVRTPDPAGLTPIWEDLTPFTLAAGQIKTFEIVSESPFTGAIAPDDPYTITGINETLNDIALSGGTALTEISRTSGRSLTLTVTALTGIVKITRIRVQATPIIVSNTILVTAEDTLSITANKIRTFSGSAPIWAGPVDAEAIATKVIAVRSIRNPTISVRIVNGSTENITQIQERDLSDLIHFQEATLGLNDNFYIESINHSVSAAGLFHETVFGAERVPRTIAGVFTFDDSALGFDTGMFGRQGFTNSANIFILGTSLLGAKVLGT